MRQILVRDKLFLDSEPEAKPATALGGLPLTGSERNATIAGSTVNLLSCSWVRHRRLWPHSISFRFCQGWRSPFGNFFFYWPYFSLTMILWYIWVLEFFCWWSILYRQWIYACGYEFIEFIRWELCQLPLIALSIIVIHIIVNNHLHLAVFRTWVQPFFDVILHMSEKTFLWCIIPTVSFVRHRLS